MATPKPTVILVPGAWHQPTSFNPMTSLLEAAGYTCIGVKLPSIGGPKPTESFDEDVDAIRSAIKAEVDAEHDVLVFVHSYGSMPTGEAIKGLDKASVRKDGGQGGVAHIFYCASFAPPKGNSLFDMLGGNPLPWFIISDDKKTVNPENPAEVFYADVPDALKKSSIDDLSPHSYRTFFSKTSWEPWREIPCTYLYCTQDKAIPIEAQRGMVEGTKAKWSEETLEASHSPFLSQPKKVADAVRRAAGEVV